MTVFSMDKQTRLLELLNEELALFERIRELTGKQAELLAAGNLEALDRSLSQRQELIGKINGLHQESEVLMQSYITFSGSAGDKKITGIETVAEKLRSVIAGCGEINEKNIKSAKGMAEEYIERIGKLSLSRKSLGAYAQSVPNNSELFDKKT